MRAVKLSGECLGDDHGLASYALTKLVLLRAYVLVGKERGKGEGVPRWGSQ